MVEYRLKSQEPFDLIRWLARYGAALAGASLVFALLLSPMVLWKAPISILFWPVVFILFALWWLPVLAVLRKAHWWHRQGFLLAGIGTGILLALVAPDIFFALNGLFASVASAFCLWWLLERPRRRTLSAKTVCRERVAARLQAEGKKL